MTGDIGEDTVIRTVELPEGLDYVWYGDANVLAFSSRLDCAGRMRAVDELQKQWRRAHLKVVETA